MSDDPRDFDMGSPPQYGDPPARERKGIRSKIVKYIDTTLYEVVKIMDFVAWRMIPREEREKYLKGCPKLEKVIMEGYVLGHVLENTGVMIWSKRVQVAIDPQTGEPVTE